MVDRKIRLLWNNGGGSATKIVTHNVTIESATSRGNLLTNEHMWYKITAERTGNIGRLNVRKVRPVSICPKSLNFNFILRYKREYRPPCAGFPQKQVFYLFFLQIYDDPDYHKWVVDESTPTSFALDAAPYDDVYVGGATVPPYFHQV